VRWPPHRTGCKAALPSAGRSTSTSKARSPWPCPASSSNGNVPPSFDAAEYHFTVNEGDPVGTVVGTVVAHDADDAALQFDIVDRLIERFSNPGDLVFDPFGGLMTVPNRALRLGRRGYASELNPSYWLDGVAYLEATEREVSMPTLFDLLEESSGA